MVCVKVELLRQNRKAGATLSAMNKITQDMRFKQAVIEYSLKHGVTSLSMTISLHSPALALNCTMLLDMVCRLLSECVSQLHSTRDRQAVSTILPSSICATYCTLSNTTDRNKPLISKENAQNCPETIQRETVLGVSAFWEQIGNSAVKRRCPLCSCRKT